MSISSKHPGAVTIGFQELSEKDFKAVLLKCSAPRRERRPRKRHRTGVGSNKIDNILSELPNKSVTHLNMVGNRTKGDAGTEHLHLLPPTVYDLDLSDCGITLEGVKNVCDFMKTNTSITRLVMWGNTIGDDGAACIADVLCQDKTIRDLCIMGCKIGVEGSSHISRGLAHNCTLHVIDLGNGEKVGDEHVRRLCPGLAVNQGLQTLALKNIGITNRGLEPIEVALPENYYLKSVELNQGDDEEHYIEVGLGTTWFNICSIDGSCFKMRTCPCPSGMRL